MQFNDKNPLKMSENFTLHNKYYMPSIHTRTFSQMKKKISAEKKDMYNDNKKMFNIPAIKG